MTGCVIGPLYVQHSLNTSEPHVAYEDCCLAAFGCSLALQVHFLPKHISCTFKSGWDGRRREIDRDVDDFDSSVNWDEAVAA